MFELQNLWKKPLPNYLEEFMHGCLRRYVDDNGQYPDWLKIPVFQCLLKWYEEGAASLEDMMNDVELFVHYPVAKGWNEHFYDGKWDDKAYAYLGLPSPYSM
jgi:hypothetical protein